MHKPAFIALVKAVMPHIQEISCKEANTLTREEIATLIDVREDHEWQRGHAQGAIHLGKGIIERDIEGVIPDKDRKLLLYCGGGYRSALAAHNLQQMGYENVYSIAGGWKQWQQENLPQSTSDS